MQDGADIIEDPVTVGAEDINDVEAGGNDDGKDAWAKLEEGVSATADEEGVSAPADEEGKEVQGQDEEGGSSVAAATTAKVAPKKITKKTQKKNPDRRAKGGKTNK